MAYSHHSTNKRSFSHLTVYQRGQIKALREQGLTFQRIADYIGCHKATVSREWRRGLVTQKHTNWTTYQTYLPDTGQTVYDNHRRHCGAKRKLADISDFMKFALEKMQQDHWSPDAVCGYVKTNKLFEKATICTKTLYNYIEQGLLPVKNMDLPLKVKRSPKKRRVRQNKRLAGASIEQRPSHVDERREFGHWEIDTVLGQRKKGSALMTLTERKTRAEIIIKIERKSAAAIDQAIKHLKHTYGRIFTSLFKSITSDNGTEFTQLTAALGTIPTAVYYTHPYTSSERGTNERHNSLIRRFIPKGTSMDHLDPAFITSVENWCNTLPRKILGYRTPMDLYHEELEKLIG